MDHIFLGGEKHTLNGFKKRCSVINRHNHKIMNRVLDIDIPNKKLIRMREPREMSNSKKRRSSWTRELFRETMTNE